MTYEEILNRQLDELSHMARDLNDARDFDAGLATTQVLYAVNALKEKLEDRGLIACELSNL